MNSCKVRTRLGENTAYDNIIFLVYLFYFGISKMLSAGLWNEKVSTQTQEFNRSKSEGVHSELHRYCTGFMGFFTVIHVVPF